MTEVGEGFPGKVAHKLKQKGLVRGKGKRERWESSLGWGDTMSKGFVAGWNTEKKRVREEALVTRADRAPAGKEVGCMGPGHARLCARSFSFLQGPMEFKENVIIMLGVIWKTQAGGPPDIVDSLSLRPSYENYSFWSQS